MFNEAKQSLTVFINFQFFFIICPYYEQPWSAFHLVYIHENDLYGLVKDTNITKFCILKRPSLYTCLVVLILMEAS